MAMSNDSNQDPIEDMKKLVARANTEKINLKPSMMICFHLKQWIKTNECWLHVDSYQHYTPKKCVYDCPFNRAPMCRCSL